MKHYSVRTAPREDLIAALREFADDRERVGKQERADGARAAAAQLDAGAGIVFFERCYYEVGEARRHGVILRTREHLLSELDEASTGWAHHGKMELAAQARAARGKIVAGAERVQVGHLVYEVVAGDGSDTTFRGSREEVLRQIHRDGMRCARAHAKQEERELLAAQAAIEGGADRASGAGQTYVVV